MSPRNLARRCKEATGLSPHDWLPRRRLRHALRLLETTDESVELIAQRVGFGAAVTLRHHFHRRHSVSPNKYRCTFRASRERTPTGATMS